VFIFFKKIILLRYIGLGQLIARHFVTGRLILNFSALKLLLQQRRRQVA